MTWDSKEVGDLDDPKRTLLGALPLAARSYAASQRPIVTFRGTSS